ncbi:MAG: PhzF family phenazine biosynthesis protein [Candidatus Zixiibacteriota bacterium]|nr:MAG: PhzF family phenazine biosynthesis protein [candidate division Zixibacteria bacterium]
MTQMIYQVDSFTGTKFSGNPAGVCVMDDAASVKWMQNIASEMNLSETAFLFAKDDEYNLRWFTPTVEVELCGHATLAAAHILWKKGFHSRAQKIRFHTLSGLLTAEWVDGWIKLDFPSEPPRATSAPPGLLEGLGRKAVYVGKNESRYLVEIESEEAVRNLSPDMAGLVSAGAGRLIVTARADSAKYDFVSRFFAPGIGIDEDPVTGSAHCCLGPYWKDRLGKTKLVAYQASKRGGELKVYVVGDRVHIFGQAVTVFEAQLE